MQGLSFKERPPGLIQHVLTVLVFSSCVLLLPRLPPSSRILRLFPWASSLLHGPLGICLDLLPAAPLSPVQKRDVRRSSRCFLQVLCGLSRTESPWHRCRLGSVLWHQQSRISEREREKGRTGSICLGLQAQQRYFSYRAMLVAIVLQLCFCLFLWVSHGYGAICCKQKYHTAMPVGN